MKDRSILTYIVLSGAPSGLGSRIALLPVSFFLRHPSQLLLLLECGGKCAKVGNKVLLDLVVFELGSFLEETVCKHLSCSTVPLVCRGAGKIEAKILCSAWVICGAIKAICFLLCHIATQRILCLLLQKCTGVGPDKLLFNS